MTGDPAAHREHDVRARLHDVGGEQPGVEERALLARLLTGFHAKAPAALDALAEQLAHRNAALLREQAHGLKGSAANVGANALAALLAELEERARTGDLAGTAAVLDRARAETALLLPVIAGVAAGLGTPPAG